MLVSKPQPGTEVLGHFFGQKSEKSLSRSKNAGYRGIDKELVSDGHILRMQDMLIK